MKPLCFLLSAFCFSSCTVARHPTAGTYATLGGKTNGLVMDQSGIRMASNDNAEAVKSSADGINALVRTKGWFSLGKAATSEIGDITRKLTD